MRLFNYKLGGEPLKLLNDSNLLQTNKCVVKATRNTLALPILINENLEGHVFHGSGQLLIDTIVETEKGAIGKPTIKDLDKPFLMLGKTEEVKNNLATANPQELAQFGYSTVEAFVKTAEDFCNYLFNKGLQCNDSTTGDSKIFVFTNAESFDVLVAKGNELVYTSKEKVFVFKNDKEVLTSPQEVVVSKRGRTVVVAKDRVFVED